MTRRVVGFVDGQNLFYAAKQAFGYTYPNYDPRRLTEVVAEAQGWTVAGIRFYTGVPDRSDNPFWNGFWAARCDAMGSEGVVAFTRPLRYRDETVDLPGGGKGTAASTTPAAAWDGIEYRGRVGDISIYGQESNYTTWCPANMNLAIRGIDANIAQGDSFHADA